jgi:glycosyltransferase involved in cell wall biosynthesis
VSGTPGAPSGPQPLHVVQLLASGGAGVGTHVGSLTAGLVTRGVRVTVCAPDTVGRRYGFAATGARFSALPADSRTQAVRRTRAVCAHADLVHAHGMRAGLLAALAVRGRAVPLVVTWHARHRPRGAGARLRRITERWVARTASVVLGATAELVDRARHRGARDARLAPVALPAPRTSPDGPGRAVEAQKLRAELGAVGRPLLVAAGALEPGQGHELLLSAARRWRDRTPRPLLIIAGAGPLRAAFRRRIDQEGLPVRLLGRREDMTSLLLAADVALLATRWDGRGRLAQEALRCGTPLVVTAGRGVAGLVGDAAVSVPAEPAALAAAVTGLLADHDRRAALAAAGPRRAAHWHTEDRTVAQVLSVYDELTGRHRR